jgi:hypothetical protein
MKAATRGWYSSISYHPNPASADTDDGIFLGVAFEELTPKLRIVGLVARAVLTEDELRHADLLGKELLKDPVKALSREIELVLATPTEPGGILKALANKLVWSFRFGSPQPLATPKKRGEFHVDPMQLYSEAIQRAPVTPAGRPWAESPRVWQLPDASPGRAGRVGSRSSRRLVPSAG